MPLDEGHGMACKQFTFLLGSVLTAFSSLPALAQDEEQESLKADAEYLFSDRWRTIRQTHSLQS